jgi:hypothetical protein
VIFVALLHFGGHATIGSMKSKSRFAVAMILSSLLIAVCAYAAAYFYIPSRHRDRDNEGPVLRLDFASESQAEFFEPAVAVESWFHSGGIVVSYTSDEVGEGIRGRSGPMILRCPSGVTKDDGEK